jgi:ppGpp synthetase/RelA/SpoT-type nucleotidyltranferase
MTDNERIVLDTEDPRVTLEMLRTGAVQICQRLRTISASIGPLSSSSQFYTRIRSKEEDSILKKISDQQRGGYGGANPNYSFRDITDYAGVRFVTLYDNQMREAIDLMINVIEASQNISQPLFDNGNAWKHNFRESNFIPRSVSDKSDIYGMLRAHLISCIREKFRQNRDSGLPQAAAKIKLQKRDSSYSSIHVLLYANSYNLNSVVKVPLEIQIRTALEDIWSEINHKRVYKVSSAYFWTEAHSLEMEAAERISREIKDRFNRLSGEVETISQHSETAGLAIESVWGLGRNVSPPGATSGEAANAVHTSLCATLYCFISSQENNADDYEQFIKFSQQLKEILKGVRKLNNVKENYENIIRILLQLRERQHDRRKKIKKTQKEHSDNKIYVRQLDAKIEVMNQREKIINLEILRINVVFALELSNEDAVFFGNQILKVTTDPRDSLVDQRKEVLKYLYMELCKFVDDTELKIRPLCMIFFWKYLVSTQINRQLAERNVRLSYDELRSDESLPPWSIYHVAVPRSLAFVIFSEVRLLLENFRPDSVNDEVMLRFRNETKDKLVSALIYLRQAFASSQERGDDGDNRRGDIHIGFKEKEDIIDCLWMLRISSFYYRFFDEHIYAGRKSMRPLLFEARDFLVAHDIGKRYVKRGRSSKREKLNSASFNRAIINEVNFYIETMEQKP